MQPHANTACLAEDELLALGHGRSLAESPEAERHLADCATCSALLAAIVREPPAWDALAGTALGPYRLDAQIGAGGMGAVYRAWDHRLDRTIAIKVLHREATATRLNSEARAAAAVDHPAIVGIHDVGVVDGTAYVAMELVDGESLRSVIERGALPPKRTRELALELLDGLAAAHARGVIHRDLKPENLIVARDGRLRILDFGLAKLLDGTPLDATEPGTVQGTAGYLAPEQARGEPADARADLFATGAILYELATGRRAFPGATHADRLSATLRDSPPLDELGELAPVVARCLHKEPRERFQSAADLAWVLRGASAAAIPVAPSRRALLVGGAAALAGIAGLGGFLLGRRGAAVQPRRPVFRQLTFRTGRVYTARFTRDGSRLAFGAAWDGEPLRAYVFDLAARSATPLEVAGDVLSISTRGQLASAQQLRFTDHQSATGTLAIAALAGGMPRVIAPDVQDADFAPDGSLAIVRRGATGFRIELPLGTVLVESAGWLTHARVSPSGTHVAFLEHPHTNDDAGDLKLVEISTRRVRVLATGWASIAGLAWDPDGRSVWFTAAHDHGQNEVHTVALDGTQRTIAQTTGRLRLHDLAPDRRAAVTVDTWRLRAMIGERGHSERDASLSEASFVTDVAADGSMILAAELGSAETSSGAYLVPFAGGRALRLGDGFPLAIAPSGHRVAVSLLEAGAPRLVIYSTDGGERPTVAAPGLISAARWIDDATLVARSKGQLWRLALDRPPVALTAAAGAGELAIDPARQRCAFVDAAGRVRVIELATGAATTLPGMFTGHAICGWLASGRIVLRTATTPIQLTQLDPATGGREPLFSIEPPAVGLKAVDAFVIHPDGARYAYSYGQELSQLHVMTLEA
ncbi:MAG: protein kinase [Kofleriaceae bacterium]